VSLPCLDNPEKLITERSQLSSAPLFSTARPLNESPTEPFFYDFYAFQSVAIRHPSSRAAALTDPSLSIATRSRIVPRPNTSSPSSPTNHSLNRGLILMLVSYNSPCAHLTITMKSTHELRSKQRWIRSSPPLCRSKRRGHANTRGARKGGSASNHRTKG